MSDWQSLSLKFDPFAPLKPPMQSALQLLETVEAVLEALLALIKTFLLDLSNPLSPVVALLLASVRTLINQVKSTGFSVLLVHPDFSQPDFAAVLNSVSGAYPRFESKVVSKFFDTADAFRPQYPDGSTVGMLVLYVGADTPGDLMTQLFALLALLRHPVVLSGLPAPVNLRVRPVNKSGSAISQFKKLFDSDLDKALELEWSMPASPSGSNVPGFLNSAVSFFNSFRFPNFVVERSTSAQGETVQVDVKAATVGPQVDSLVQRFGLPPVNGKATVREQDGTTYREFATKIPVDSTSGLAEGVFSGTYRYLDKDPSLVAGETYYYRVRAYFGKPQQYLAFNGASSVVGSQLLHFDNNSNRWIIRYGDGVVMGQPSNVVKGFVPRPLPSNAVFNAYNDIYDAVRAGLLLNFEYPPAAQGDDATQHDQKTGWGALSVAGGQVGPLKAAFPKSTDLMGSFLFSATARRVANQALLPLRTKPSMLDLVASKWAGGAQQVTQKVLEATRSWQFIGIVGGFTKDTSPSEASAASTPSATAGQVQVNQLPNQNLAQTPTQRINNYLAKEATYRADQDFTGPFPLSPVSDSDDNYATAEERKDLADFLQLTLAAMAGQTSYLSWYSVTVGDMFPAFIPFLNDFEQFMLAMLNAVKSALQEIEDVIQTFVQKIQALEQLLQTILSLLDLLSVNVSVSALVVGPMQGSASTLAGELTSSTQKPGDNPYGLHSGLVMAFGGPGEGSVAALNALKFILTLGG